jgi:hypothetical protein
MLQNAIIYFDKEAIFWTMFRQVKKLLLYFTVTYVLHNLQRFPFKGFDAIAKKVLFRT